MTGPDLADVFGEDLAEQVTSQIAEKRQERNRVSGEQMARICSEAVNENKFKDGEPQFKYTTENNVTHTVLLMQCPDPQNSTVWEYLDEPWDGAASLPMDYLGEWMRCTFPEKEDVKKIDSGQWYIIVGDIDEYEKDNGEIIESVYPVRGIASLEEAKEYAKAALEGEGFTTSSEDEEEEEPEEEEEEDSSDSVGLSKFASGGDDDEEDEEDEEESSGGGGLGGLLDEEKGNTEEEDDSEPVPYEDVAALVEELGDQEDAVWEVTEGDSRLERLVEVVSTKLELDNEDGVEEVILDVLESHRDDDEDEEEDSGSIFGS